MNGLELTKSQKKIARQVIEKGLQKEYVDGILKLENIISKWKVNMLSNRDAWFELCKKLTKHDDHIAGRYNNMGGSKYLYIIAAQLADGVINRDDLANFDEDVRSAILLLSGMEND